jgi:hypothetical protein
MITIGRLIAKSLDPEKYPVDSQNPHWTSPKSWGTFVILDGKNPATRYRYGNYPIRLDELKAEFGSVRLLALFDNREDAKLLADLLNAEVEVAS